MKEFTRAIDTRKEYLYLKAKNKTNPTLVFVKLIPKSNDFDPSGNLKNKRHDFNLALTQAVNRTPKTAALNIDEILPYNSAQYTNSGLLSEVGYITFWQQFNLLLSKLDRRVPDPRITISKVPDTELIIEVVEHHSQVELQPYLQHQHQHQQQISLRGNF